ncbi:MAG: DrmB family protein [Candidatus Dormibacteraceae bacterium]
MTLPAPARRKSDPSVIGQARPSHLVTTGGVGAIVDLPAMSVMVRGLDAWSPERAEVVTEPRLLEQVRRVLGPQVRALREAPWDPAAIDDPWTRVGVPVSPFPRWVRCLRCFRLGPLDPPGQFELVHRWGRRPDLAKWVHTGCAHQTRTRPGNRRPCLPARFLVACDEGHLDDFPYVEFVHQGVPCAGPKLTMSDSSSTLGPRVLVKCVECKAQRSIAQAAGRDGWKALPICRGRHPHLQRFEPCGRPLRLMVLGASNLWFSVTAGALHLPLGRTVADVVAANWDLLGTQAGPEVVQLLVDHIDALRSLRDIPIEQVWAAIEERRHSGDGDTAPVGGAASLLDAEWDLLARPTTERQDEDFRAEVVDVPAGYDNLLDQVVQVPRLREVKALMGFTRILAPERRELQPINLLPLTVGSPEWVPAVEQRGEGVFLQLREDRVAAWETAVGTNPRIDALQGAYRRWATNRSRLLDAGFPTARYVLLHTLSHLLIREIALECGYSSASVRERIYIGEPGRRYAGLLLSTAANDSEGTLGGLVALGQPTHLRRLLDQALDNAERCSTDPLCAEHVPEPPSDGLHAAACHACLFASETSCEANNRWLDRAVLVDITGDGLAFPK